MLGKCFNCNKDIFKFVRGNIVRPLGNYRSAMVNLDNGNSFEIPLCLNCFNVFCFSNADIYIERLKKYILELSPDDWNDIEKQELINLFNANVIGIKKIGALKSEDIKNGKAKVWK